MEGQRWNPEEYARNARFVSDLGEPVLDLLAPLAGERVLDLGCGDGVLTRKICEAGCAVVAVDSSPEQVAAARAQGLDARVENAESLPFDGEFEAVFSNAVLHWVKDHDAMLEGVSRALVPGGRFVAELGGAGCVQEIRSALHVSLAGRGVDAESLDPWFFPTPGDYGVLLERHGFAIDSLALFPRPTPLPGDISGWLETFAQPFLGGVVEEERRNVVAEVRDALRSRLFTAEQGWVADYVRLRFRVRRS